MRGSIVTLPNEQALVARAKEGDRAAFDELLQSHRNRLESWIRTHVGARVRSKVDIDDLVQDTHLRAFESMRRFTWRGESSFQMWLQAIAEHLVWNASQKKSTGEIALSVDTPKSSVSPSRHVRRDERFDRLEKALKDLRPEEKEAVRLSRFEGLKIREIADRLNKSESAVKSLIARSLRKVRESFGDTESFNLPDRRLDVGETDDE